MRTSTRWRARDAPYRVRMDEAAAATKLGKGSASVDASLEEGRAALNKLRAAGAVDAVDAEMLQAELDSEIQHVRQGREGRSSTH